MLFSLVPFSSLSARSRARLKVALAVICAALFVLPFRIAARDGRGAGAALGLLLSVVLLFSPWAIRRWQGLTSELRQNSAHLAWKLALAAAFGNIAQGYAFQMLHAGVAATVVQMNVLFVGLLGALWLREALGWMTILGLLLSVLGAALTQSPLSLTSRMLDWGVIWGLAAALGFSMMDLLSRRDAHGVDSVVTNVLRSLGAALLLAALPAARTQLMSMGPHELLACCAASVLGPGFARQLLISASRDLPAVESALLQQLRPLLALPLASVVFASWPTVWQWIGCGLITVGVVVPSLHALVVARSQS